MGNGTAPNIAIDSPGAFLGLSIVEAAKKLLTSKRQPLRKPDIVAGFKAGGFILGSKDPVNTVGAVLTRRANEVGDIVKVGRGTWGLKEWFPGRSFKREKTESGDKGEAAAVAEAVEGTPAAGEQPRKLTMQEVARGASAAKAGSSGT